MRDFNFCYDAYQNLEAPDLYLANGNREYLSSGALTVFNLNTELYFNQMSSVTFTVYNKVNGVENEDYDNILEGNSIQVNNIGWFQISSIKEDNTGSNKQKNVTALSFENELCTKKIASLGEMGIKDDWDGGLDRYWLYNPTSPDNSILHLVIQKNPDWKIGNVDVILTDEMRSITESSIDCYSLLTKTCSEAWDCVFYFNINDLTINAYHIDNIGQLSDLYFSYHNVVKNIEKNIEIGDIKTVLYVQGGDYGTTTLGISEVNPTGSNYIYNFDYFKPRMSTELRNQLEEYESLHRDSSNSYTNLLARKSELLELIETYKNKVPRSELSNYNAQLDGIETSINYAINDAYNRYKTYTGTLTKAEYVEQDAKVSTLRKQYKDKLDEKLAWLKDNYDTVTSEWELYGLNELQTQRDACNGVCSVFLQLKASGDKIGTEIYNDNFTKIHGSTYNSYTVQTGSDPTDWYYYGSTDCISYYIGVRKEQIANCEKSLADVNDKLAKLVLDIRGFLGDKLYKELSHYVYEDEYTDTSYVATKIMTDSERLDMERKLLNEATKELNKISKPNPTFTLNSMNLFAVKDFIDCSAVVTLGDFATIELSEDENIEVRLLKISINWDTKDFELTFSSNTSLEDGKWQLQEIRDQASSSSNTLTLSGNGWNYSKNESSQISKYISNALDTSTQKIKNSDKEEVVVDNTGIRGRRWDENINGYSKEEIWMTSNLLCFSNDGFNTSKMAIGKIDFNGSELYGVVADAIVGNIIAGQNLLISNSEGSFTVNGEGVSVTDLDLRLYDKPAGSTYGGLITLGNNDNVGNITGANDSSEGISGHYIPFCIGKTKDGKTFSKRSVYYDMTSDIFTINGGTIKSTSLYSSTINGGSIVIGGNYGSDPVFTVDSTGRMTAKKAIIDGDIIGGSININDNFIVNSYGSVTLPANAQIRWVNSIGQTVTENIPTSNSIRNTIITKDYIETLNIKAAKVETYSNGKSTVIDGGSITTNSANITGGNISIESDIDSVSLNGNIGKLNVMLHNGSTTYGTIIQPNQVYVGVIDSGVLKYASVSYNSIGVESDYGMSDIMPGRITVSDDSGNATYINNSKIFTDTIYCENNLEVEEINCVTTITCKTLDCTTLVCNEVWDAINKNNADIDKDIQYLLDKVSTLERKVSSIESAIKK